MCIRDSHEIYAALGFEKQGWPLLGVLVPYTFLVMLSSYELYRRLVMPASFLVVLFYAIYLVVRNGTISYQKASGLAMFSGIVIFCFYSVSYTHLRTSPSRWPRVRSTVCWRRMPTSTIPACCHCWCATASGDRKSVV